MANLNISSYNTIGSLGKEVDNLDISYDKFNLKSKIQSNNSYLIINSSSLIDKYFDIIMKNTDVITLTDKEYITYRYRPKSYCLDIYGTTELWSILLKINNWTSMSEFNAKTFKIMNSSIFTILNEILTLEADKIIANKSLIE